MPALTLLTQQRKKHTGRASFLKAGGVRQSPSTQTFWMGSAKAKTNCVFLRVCIKTIQISGCVGPIWDQAGGGLRKNEIIYYNLLRKLRTFISEIMVLLQGNLFTLKRFCQIGHETLYFLGKSAKIGTFLLRILRNFFIAEYFGKLQSVMHPWTPPPADPKLKRSLVPGRNFIAYNFRKRKIPC
jgi:hypothetical protein